MCWFFSFFFVLLFVISSLCSRSTFRFSLIRSFFFFYLLLTQEITFFFSFFFFISVLTLFFRSFYVDLQKNVQQKKKRFYDLAYACLPLFFYVCSLSQISHKAETKYCGSSISVVALSIISFLFSTLFPLFLCSEIGPVGLTREKRRKPTRVQRPSSFSC